MVAVAGVTAMETRAADCTVRVAVPTIVPLVAVIAGAPTAVAVANPPLVMLAPVPDVHVTELSARVVPSV